MNSKQEARLNMYDAVLAHCDANAAIVATVPAFQTAVNNFEDIVDDLRQAAQDEISATTGYALDKAEQRKNLSQLTLDMSGAIYAYAASVNNLVLREQVHITPSDLLRLKDELLGPACSNIVDAANANAAALVPFGVTAAKITVLEDAIDDYISAVPAPRNAVANRASIAESIRQYFKSADELLKKQIDKLAVQFQSTHPNFYNAYRSNRVILDPASSATQVSGTVTDQWTNNPVADVIIQVVDQAYSTTTNSDGEYILKIPVPGEYNITFSKTGYVTKTEEDVEVTLGGNTSLDIILNQNPT